MIMMTALAETSPVGARGIIFNPNLGGGSSVDESINIRGAYLGLDSGHNRADIDPGYDGGNCHGNANGVG